MVSRIAGRSDATTGTPAAMNSNNFIGDENFVKWSLGGDGITPTSHARIQLGTSVLGTWSTKRKSSTSPACGYPGGDIVVDVVHRPTDAQQ